MKTAPISLGLAALLAAQGASTYEWKSHNGMAANARDIFLGESKSHQPPFGVDPDLVTFLSTYDDDLDTRAGDLDENAFTDEDHTEGYLREIFTCTYRERDCWHAGFYARSSLWVAPCTLDHFFPRLPLPIPSHVAPVHARDYLDMAVKLYKAAKCDRWGLRDYSMRRARALRHAIHQSACPLRGAPAVGLVVAATTSIRHLEPGTRRYSRPAFQRHLDETIHSDNLAVVIAP